jgi:hypothetical protein
MAILPHGAGMSPNNKHIPPVERFVLVDLLKSVSRLMLIARYRWHSITCRLLRQVISREENTNGNTKFDDEDPHRAWILVFFESHTK